MNLRYIDLVVFLLLLTVMISPVAAADVITFPTWIDTSGSQQNFNNGVFTVRTTDTDRKHNLKAKVMYTGMKGNIKALNWFKSYLNPKNWGVNVYFECWENPQKDNNHNGVYGELLYTEKDHVSFFDSEAQVNPAKWYKHGVPTGKYDIKIKFNELYDHHLLGDNIYSASQVTVPFRLLP